MPLNILSILLGYSILENNMGEQSALMTPSLFTSVNGYVPGQPLFPHLELKLRVEGFLSERDLRRGGSSKDGTPGTGSN